jgi:hypothetical protein
VCAFARDNGEFLTDGEFLRLANDGLKYNLRPGELTTGTIGDLRCECFAWDDGAKYISSIGSSETSYSSS